MSEQQFYYDIYKNVVERNIQVQIAIQIAISVAVQSHYRKRKAVAALAIALLEKEHSSNKRHKKGTINNKKRF